MTINPESHHPRFGETDLSAQPHDTWDGTRDVTANIELELEALALQVERGELTEEQANAMADQLLSDS